MEGIAPSMPGRAVCRGGECAPVNGSGSDPDGNAFTYAWTQTGGPAVSLSDATAAKPTFTASDFEGSCSHVVTVSVPHDKKGDVAIDGGELFDSTH